MKNLIAFTIIGFIMFSLTSCNKLIPEQKPVTILHKEKFRHVKNENTKYWLVPVKTENSIINVRYYSRALSSNLFEEIYKIKNNGTIEGVIYQYDDYWSLERIYTPDRKINEKTIKLQLVNNALAVYSHKKIVSGELIDSYEFDSVLILNDTVDLNSWIGNIIDPSYIVGENESGWSILKNNPEYGIGNVQINNTGEIFVDIAMYRTASPKYIMNMKYQRIYLTNKKK